MISPFIIDKRLSFYPSKIDLAFPLSCHISRCLVSGQNPSPKPSPNNCSWRSQVMTSFKLRQNWRFSWDNHGKTIGKPEENHRKPYVNGLVSGKIYRKAPYLMGKSMVSGFDFPLNQSIERTGQRPM